MMRPTTIVAFEALYFVTLAIGVLQAYLSWDQLQAMASPFFIVTIQIVTVGLLILLTLLVSRRRSRFAKWVLVVLFVIGLPMTLRIFVSGQLAGSPLLTVSQSFLQLIGLVLLFTPASRAWLAKND